MPSRSPISPTAKPSAVPTIKPSVFPTNIRPSHAPVLASQDTAMCDLFRATNIPYLLSKGRAAGWTCDAVTNIAINLCQSGSTDWTGVTCTGSVVTGLDFRNNVGQVTQGHFPETVTGKLPTSLGVLTGLQNVDMSYSSINGPIPTSIGSLVSLTKLKLSNSAITGTIPSQVSGMTNLVVMDFSISQVKGSIPSTISALTKLQSITMQSCSITGSIPLSITTMKSLVTLNIARNSPSKFYLTGQIPSGLAQVTTLVNLV